MARKETRVQRIIRLTAKQFPSFGGGKKSGVDVEMVVRFVLAKHNALERMRRQKYSPGDDMRDYMNNSDLLKPLSKKLLGEITRLGRSEIRMRLKEKRHPFSRLNEQTRETLLYLPSSWVLGAAQWLLDIRSEPKKGSHAYHRAIADDKAVIDAIAD